MEQFKTLHIGNSGKEEMRTANILLAGNVTCQDALLIEKELYGDKIDFMSCFKEIKKISDRFDLMIGSISSNGNHLDEYYSALKDSGFDLLTVASNKSNDRRSNIYPYLDAGNINYAEGAEEYNNVASVILEINGIRMGLLDCTFFELADMDSISSVRVTVNNMKDINCDVILCYVHWRGYFMQGARLNEKQKGIVTLLADMGIDYITGAGIYMGRYEMLKSSWNRKVPVLYSLGNFISCAKFYRSKTGAVLNLEIEKDDKGNIHISDSYLPCFTFINYGNNRRVTALLNDKKYKGSRRNEIVANRKSFVANMLGEDISLSHEFDSRKSGKRKDNNEVVDNIVASRFSREILSVPTELQKEIMDSYRLTDEFREIYGKLVLNDDKNSGMVEGAKNAIKKYNHDSLSEKEQQEMIVDLLYTKNVLRFSYIEYFGFDFRHRSIKERTEFMSDEYRFNYYRRLHKNQQEIDSINNKYASYLRLKDYYKRDMIYIENPKDLETFKDFVAEHNEFIIKPASGSLGAGIKILKASDYENVETLFNDLISKGAYVCEELIIQKESLGRLHPQSVNSVRIFTYNNGTSVQHVCAWLKIGVGNAIVDNGGAGGLVAAIDMDSGIVVENAGNESGVMYKKHPDSGIVFKDLQLEEWDSAKKLVSAAAAEYPEVNLIAWDIALSGRGWQIIEANSQGQVDVYQNSTKRGMRREFEEIIGWVNCIKDER